MFMDPYCFSPDPTLALEEYGIEKNLSGADPNLKIRKISPKVTKAKEYIFFIILYGSHLANLMKVIIDN